VCVRVCARVCVCVNGDFITDNTNRWNLSEGFNGVLDS